MSKMLVVLPSEDVRRIDAEVESGRYVTKSDFLRAAVKQLLDADERAKTLETVIERLQIKINSTQAPEQPTRATILAELKANRHRINALGVKKIGLFGSYANNSQRQGSDVDILVEFHKGKNSFHNYMDLKLLLEGIFKARVDLVEKRSVRPELRGSILKGIIYA